MWLVWFTSAGGWVGPFQCFTASDVFNQLHQHGGVELYQKWHFDPSRQSWAFDGATAESGLPFPLVMEGTIYLQSAAGGPAFFIAKQ